MALTKMELLEAIAHKWGGLGCKTVLERGYRYSIFANDGMNYVVWFPGVKAHLRQEDGRPFTKRVPAGELWVDCTNDAPGNWWVVKLDGSYRTIGSSGVLPDTPAPADDHGPGCDGPFNCTCPDPVELEEETRAELLAERHAATTFGDRWA